MAARRLRGTCRKVDFRYRLSIKKAVENGNKAFGVAIRTRNEVSRKGAAVGVVVLLVVAGAGASTGVLGPLSALADDLPGTSGDADPTSAPESNADDGGSGSDDGGGGGSAGTPTEREPFGIRIVSVEECGDTCRDVTIRVTNRLNESAGGVGIVSRIFAGKRGDDGDELWEGEAGLGTIGASSSVTVEKRVKLGYFDAAKVKNNDGWITVRTTVTSDDAEATYVEEKNVA